MQCLNTTTLKTRKLNDKRHTSAEQPIVMMCGRACHMHIPSRRVEMINDLQLLAEM